MRPEIRYADTGDGRVAYWRLGDGDLDLVYAPAFLSHLDLFWDHPPYRRHLERLASFSRLLVFDRRGVGLSDPVSEVPTLDDRMVDVLAVMDDAGVERAALFGASEGAPASILTAATHPDRVGALVLYGAMARASADDDYPLAAPIEAYRAASEELVLPFWGTGATADVFVPSVSDDPSAREFYARLEREGASPRMALLMFDAFLQVDVRDVLPAVHVPTLVLHRHGDRVVSVRAGRWLAEHIDGARFVELAGIDHGFAAGDDESIAREVEAFLTGTVTGGISDRVLATVMFSDIVGSTERAAELGDRRWRALLDAHDAAVRGALTRFEGREVKTTGDGFLATFDRPSRSIECARAVRDACATLGVTVRIGLHSGECEMRGDDVSGMAVHVAARVGALAGPGEVLATRTVKDLVVGSGIEFTDRGEHELKGVPDRWSLVAVADGS